MKTEDFQSSSAGRGAAQSSKPARGSLAARACPATRLQVEGWAAKDSGVTVTVPTVTGVIAPSSDRIRPVLMISAATDGPPSPKRCHRAASDGCVTVVTVPVSGDGESESRRSLVPLSLARAVRQVRRRPRESDPAQPPPPTAWLSGQESSDPLSLSGPAPACRGRHCQQHSGRGSRRGAAAPYTRTVTVTHTVTASRADGHGRGSGHRNGSHGTGRCHWHCQ